MKANLLILPLLILASACTSLKEIDKNPNCVVWKEQKYLGPYSIEVIENRVSWDSICKGSPQMCPKVSVSYDDSKNVFYNQTPVGKIEGHDFFYIEKNAKDPLITYTSLKGFPELKEVRASITKTTTTETVYFYNSKCTSEQALIGGIALGVIASIPKNN